MRNKILLITSAFAVAAPLPVLAYIGPGAGLSAIGAALALVGAILLGIVGFLWYPVKRLMKRRKTAESDDGGNRDGQDSPEKPQPPKAPQRNQRGTQ